MNQELRKTAFFISRYTGMFCQRTKNQLGGLTGLKAMHESPRPLRRYVRSAEGLQHLEGPSSALSAWRTLRRSVSFPACAQERGYQSHD